MKIVHIVIVGITVALEVLEVKYEYIGYRIRIESMVVNNNNNKMIVIIPIEILLNAFHNHIKW